MKKLLTLGIAVLFSVMAFATDPAQFLPAKAGLIVYADGLRLAEEYEKMDTSAAAPEAQKKIAVLNQALKAHSVAMQQIFSGPMFMTSSDDDLEDCGILFSTSIPEESIQQLVLDILAVSDIQFESSVIRSGKRMIYTFSPKGATEDDDKQALCLTYVTNDVILLFFEDTDDLEDVDKFLKGLGGNPLVEKLDRSQLLSVYCDITKLEDDPEKIKRIGFDKFAVSCNLVGPNDKDVELSAKFACFNKEALQQLNMQVNMMVPMMLGMIFGKEPEISNELVKGFSLSADGNMFNVSLKISEELSKRINTYCANPANFQPPAQQAPATTAAPAAK